MRPGEVRLERLLGRKVVDRDGRDVGRLEEVRVERRGDDYVVREYLIGTTALIERLSLGAVQRHEGRTTGGYRARWDQLDLSDPFKPRLTCRLEDLRNLPKARDDSPGKAGDDSRGKAGDDSRGKDR